MATRSGYITIITLSNGNVYPINVRPGSAFETIASLQIRGEEFWEIKDDIFIKISDISSVDQRVYRVNFDMKE